MRWGAGPGRTGVGAEDRCESGLIGCWRCSPDVLDSGTSIHHHGTTDKDSLDCRRPERNTVWLVLTQTSAGFHSAGVLVEWAEPGPEQE